MKLPPGICGWDMYQHPGEQRGLLMAIVAGVDFGTLSVRVSIVDSERGLLESAVAEYPLHRKREDPEFATQAHEDHMRALAAATRAAVKKAGITGDRGAKPSHSIPRGRL